MTDLDTLSKILATATVRAYESFGELLPMDMEQDFEAAGAVIEDDAGIVQRWLGLHDSVDM